MTNLKRNVLVAQSDLKFLSSVLVLLWPLCVVLPRCCQLRAHKYEPQSRLTS